MEDLGWRRRSSKIRGKDEEVSIRAVLYVNQGVWEENKWKDTDEENIEPHNKVEGRICTEERENLSLV